MTGMRFLISVVDSATNTATSSEIEQIDQFNDDLRANDEFVLACGLAHPTESMIIDNRTGDAPTANGPLHRDDQFISGFWVIEVADNAVAQTRATAASRACGRSVELRQVL